MGDKANNQNTSHLNTLSVINLNEDSCGKLATWCESDRGETKPEKPWQNQENQTEYKNYI